MNNNAGMFMFILIIAACFIYFINIIMKKRRRKKTKNNIIYQDGRIHPLKYNRISICKDIPFHDFQYVYYLLSLIHQLPTDQFIIIYCHLIKWKNENYLKIEKDNDIIHICFYQNKVSNRIENDLYQMLYNISQNDVLDFYTLKIWFQTEYQQINEWIKTYIQDKDYQLKNSGMIINEKYSLEIYHDFQKLIGYKKFLEMYNYQIRNEEEYLYALLFELDVEKLDLYPTFMSTNILHPTFYSSTIS